MALAKKQLRSFRLGRVNVRKEAQRQARLRSSLERPLLKKLETLIRKGFRTSASAIESNTYEPLVIETQLREEGLAVLSNHIRKVYQAVFQQNEERYQNLTKAEEMSVFGRNVDIERLSIAYLQDRELVLANVFSNISEQINRIIGEGFLEDGLSQREIAKRIREKAPQISKSRAALITRTETHSAVGHAQHAYHEVLRDSIGVNMSKRWVSTADGRTRSAHAAANGQTVEMDEDFLVGGARMRFTGDPRGGARNVINCRCTVVYVNDEDIEDAIDTAKPESTVKPQVRIAELVTGEDGDLVERELMEDLTALTASVAAKLPKPPRIIMQDRKEEDDGYYDYRNTLQAQLGKEKSGFKKLTLAHEYGHHVDSMIGEKLGFVRRDPHWSYSGLKKATTGERKKYGLNKSWERRTEKDIALLEKWREELLTPEIYTVEGLRKRRWIAKFEGADLCSDIVDSISKGVFTGILEGLVMVWPILKKGATRNLKTSLIYLL